MNARKTPLLLQYRNLVQNHYGWVLLVGILSAALCGLVVKDLRIKSNLATLLPDSRPSVQNLNRILEKTGGYGELIAIIETDNHQAAKTFAEALRKRMLEKPYVRYADYRIDLSVLSDNALLFMETADLTAIRDRLKARIDYEKLAANPLYVDLEDEGPPPLDFSDLEAKYQKKRPGSGGESDGFRYFASKDKKILLLVCYPSGITSDIGFARKINKDFEAEIAALSPQAFAPDLRVAVAGNFRNRIEEYNTIVHDVFSSTAYSLSAIYIVISLYYWNLFAFFLIFFPLATSIIWTFALSKSVIGDLNLITAFLFVVLFGMGIDYGIHILSRYLEDRRRGISQNKALRTIYTKTSKALFTAASTTAASFFLLLFTEFKGFSHFGFIAGFGVSFAFIAMTFLFPAVLVAAERWKLLPIKSAVKIAGKFEPRPFPLPRFLVAVGVLSALVGVYALPHLEFEYDFAKLRNNIPVVQENKNKVRQVFPQSRDPAVIYVEDDSELPLIEQAIKARMAADKTPTLSGVESLLDVLPRDQDNKLILVTDIKNLLKYVDRAKLDQATAAKLADFEKALAVRKLGFEDLPDGLKRRFRSEKTEKGSLFFIYNAVQLNNGLKAIEFAADISQVETAQKTYHPSSEALIFADLVHLLTRDSLIAMILTALSVIFLLYLDFRKIWQTLFVLSPLIFGLLWMCAVMWAFDIKFNLYNMVVLPSMIGLGVDHGVHIYRRYLEEKEGSVVYILLKTGGASSMCTITTVLGFAGMLSASHSGLKTIGVLAILGMVATLVSTLTILPALIQIRENRQLRKAKAQPLNDIQPAQL